MATPKRPERRLIKSAPGCQIDVTGAVFQIVGDRAVRVPVSDTGMCSVTVEKPGGGKEQMTFNTKKTLVEVFPDKYKEEAAPPPPPPPKPEPESKPAARRGRSKPKDD